MRKKKNNNKIEISQSGKFPFLCDLIGPFILLYFNRRIFIYRTCSDSLAVFRQNLSKIENSKTESKKRKKKIFSNNDDERESK
jgi:hypothetical protein